MKKLIYSSLLLGLSFGLFAQEAAEKKVQAGIVFGAGMNFQKMNTKRIDNDGIGANLMVGANVNFGFTNTIGLTTGVEFDFDGSKYKPNQATYYHFDDTEILRHEDSGNNSLYNLTERNQKAIYLTVPTMLIFRTNYIGYFRYFGKFGLRNSFLLSSKANDNGMTREIGSLDFVASANDGMKLQSGNDMFFYRGSVGIAGGAEWNFVGTTCLALEVGYYYGFTPLYYNPKDDKRTLFNQDLLGNRTYINNLANQSQLLFKVSFLF